jgi:antitoxin component of RelBE/YafQ-DinJ toxin-antitoxin module
MPEETRINIRISPELKAKFLAWCELQGTTPSDDLRRYMTKCVNEAKPAK